MSEECDDDELFDEIIDCVAFLLGNGDTEITLEALSAIDIVDKAETELEATVEYEGRDVTLTDNIEDTVMYAVFVATLAVIESVEEEETEIAGVKVPQVVADGTVETDTDAVDDDETRALLEAETELVTNDETDTTTVAETVEVPINDCVNAVEAVGCDDALLDGDD